MKTRFAFAGFRHNHIYDLLSAVEEREDTEVVACCEEDPGARIALAEIGRVKVSHTNYLTMLAEVECDVVAIGDYYGRRGQLAIAALRAGRHVISDKPLCTSLDEQMEIERLAHSRNLTVGLQLDSRDRGVLRTLREVVRSGAIGDVCTIRIDGQHPLLFGTRAAWYFEHGRHGGTINDIGIHAFDFVPWITGLNWGYIAAARSWNAKAASAPLFEDCAQVMAVLSNGAGVLADFSYLAPDKLGYELPHYWRVLIHGTKGLADTYLLANGVTVIKDDSTAPEVHPAGPGRARGYLEDFLLELRGEGERAELTSEQCLCASRLALDAQRQAVHC